MPLTRPVFPTRLLICGNAHAVPLCADSALSSSAGRGEAPSLGRPVLLLLSPHVISARSLLTHILVHSTSTDPSLWNCFPV